MPEDPRHYIARVDLDASVGAGSPDQEKERQVAIQDLIKSNFFEPAGSPGGPYELRLALVDDRLELDIHSDHYAHRHLLSVTALRRTIRDYFEICDSYRAAVSGATAGQIETLDMARRGLHNDGAEHLRARLDGKVDTDLATARRLFTLICALHWRGA